MSWAASALVDGYVAIMLAGSGEKTYCNTTETHCTFDGLECGESYTVVVMSNNGSCLSLPSRDSPIEEGTKVSNTSCFVVMDVYRSSVFSSSLQAKGFFFFVFIFLTVL